MQVTRRRKLPIQTRSRLYVRNYWQLWVLLLPAIIYIFVFNYVPMYGVQLAFRDYNFRAGITGGQWQGLKYFRQYFESSSFRSTITNTFVISAASIVMGFPAPIILAMIVNQIRSNKWRRVVQTTVTLPYFISIVVLVSMMNIMLSSNNGVIKDILVALRIVPESANLLGSSRYFVLVYVISGIWQTAGWSSIIYLAALSAVDMNLYDAAKIDGANRWQTIIHIDFPAIRTTAVILLILSMGGILNVGFDKAFLMQNSLNLGASQVISTYVYNVGIQSSQFSFGAAVGLFNTVVNFVFLVITNFVSRRITGSGLM